MLEEINLDKFFKTGTIELSDKSILKASEAISDFIVGLKSDEHLFSVVQSNEDDDYEDDYYKDEYQDDYDDYSPSY